MNKAPNNIYIIAEIGINHNGDLNIAKELIKNASECGANAVKFQKRTIDKVYSKEILDQSRESPWGNTQRDQKYGLEFEHSEYKEINDYCDSLEIDWFASAWDIESLDFLKQFNLKYNKVASAMITDLILLENIAKMQKHTFISTGMSSKFNIDNAVNIFKKYNCSYELMHCVSTYPMEAKHANLNTISSLKKTYSCNVGYSGHENGIAISTAAAAFSISSLERHITLDRTMYGSDQAASLEMKGFRQLIGAVRKVELALGEDKIGEILDEEIPIANKLRAHIKN
jgi:N-acetylneuraminate synthase